MPCVYYFFYANYQDLKMETSIDEECLKERKWWCFFSSKIIYYIFIIIRWCFFLSSVFTFVVGVASVLIIRVFNSVFRKKVKLRKIDENTLISTIGFLSAKRV